jgi:Zinc-binding dehydrogenase
VKAAGIRRFGGGIETLELPEPRALRPDEVLVASDGRRLSRLVQLLAEGTLTIRVGEQFPLEQGAAALAQVRSGAHGTAIVLQPGG